MRVAEGSQPMNSTATRRSVSTPVVDGSLDENLLRGLQASPPVTRGRNRGKSMARGLSVQLAYGSIDAFLVVVTAAALKVRALSAWRSFKRQFILLGTGAGIGVSGVLIVGGGRLGLALDDWLRKNPHLAYSVCGFIDENPSSGPRVLGIPTD